MKSDQRQRVMIGEAGEHLVVSRLLARGYVAGQLPRTYKQDDVYAEVNDHAVQLQVKTRLGVRSWPIGKVRPSERRFYAFVLLPSLEPPGVDGSVV